MTDARRLGLVSTGVRSLRDHEHGVLAENRADAEEVAVSSSPEQLLDSGAGGAALRSLLVSVAQHELLTAIAAVGFAPLTTAPALGRRHRRTTRRGR